MKTNSSQKPKRPTAWIYDYVRRCYVEVPAHLVKNTANVPKP